MRLGEIRAVDGMDVVFLLLGMVAGAALVAVVWLVLAPERRLDAPPRAVAVAIAAAQSATAK